MQLASIESQTENDQLERHIKEFGELMDGPISKPNNVGRNNIFSIQTGFGNEHFWTAGTDQGEEGSFFWMSTGRPVTFTNWNAGEPVKIVCT